jgi:hypothetical protein
MKQSVHSGTLASPLPFVGVHWLQSQPLLIDLHVLQSLSPSDGFLK